MANAFDTIMLGITAGLPKGHPIRREAEFALDEVGRTLAEISSTTIDWKTRRLAEEMLKSDHFECEIDESAGLKEAK